MREALAPLLLKVAFWVPLALATAAALLPAGAPMPFAVSDVLLHAFAFTYLTAALGVAHFPSRRYLVVALWMFGYGVALELIQSQIPPRSAEIKDVLVDVVGIAFGLGAWRAVILLGGSRLDAWRTGRETS